MVPPALGISVALGLAATFCTVGGSCLGDGGDPFWTGTESSCCGGLKKCLKKEFGWQFRCQFCEVACPDEADYSSRECVATTTTTTLPSRSAGDPTSFKRGIARKELSAADLQVLSEVTSWGYTWQVHPGEALMRAFKDTGVQFIPMVWGLEHTKALQDLPETASAVLGFNEPNFPDQANMNAELAASMWPQVQAAAVARGIPIIVGPAVNFHQNNPPIEWLDEFFLKCTGCRVDAIALHSYTCEWKWLKQHLDLYRKYNKPLWLTEFACEDDASKKNAAGQMEYMREAIPELEKDEQVYRYAWFSYAFGGSEAELVKDGQLTQLGELYSSFGAPSAPGIRLVSSGYKPEVIVHTALLLASVMYMRGDFMSTVL